jgi:hypothetical protein
MITISLMDEIEMGTILEYPAYMPDCLQAAYSIHDSINSLCFYSDIAIDWLET